jgi:hypothetical protein
VGRSGFPQPGPPGSGAPANDDEGTVLGVSLRLRLHRLLTHAPA